MFTVIEKWWMPFRVSYIVFGQVYDKGQIRVIYFGKSMCLQNSLILG